MDGLLRNLFQFLVIVGIFVVVAIGIWLTTRTRFYRDWEKKQLEREIAEQKSRPKPPWADDPVAKSIEWTGTSAFGADPNINPKGAAVRIKSVSVNRVEFGAVSAWGLHAWMLFFGAVGFILVFISSGSFAKALLAPLVCLGFSVVISLARRESLVFDKQFGMYWRGKRPPALTVGATSSHQLGRISDIYALQLIGTRRYRGDPRMGADSEYREFPTYELNLVLKDGTRLSTVSHGDLGRLERDAKVLADFLQRPLWNPATTSPPPPS